MPRVYHVLFLKIRINKSSGTIHHYESHDDHDDHAQTGNFPIAMVVCQRAHPSRVVSRLVEIVMTSHADVRLYYMYNICIYVVYEYTAYEYIVCISSIYTHTYIS